MAQDSLFKGYKKRLVNLPTHADNVEGSGDASGGALVTAAVTVDVNDLEHQLSYGKSAKVPKVSGVEGSFGGVGVVEWGRWGWIVN